MRLPSALPTLAGGWLKTFRITWFVLFALAVVGGTAGRWSGYATNWAWYDATYGAGILLRQEAARFTVSPLAPEIAAAGVVPGSTLLAVDGRRVSDRVSAANGEALAEALDGPDGTVKRLTLRSPDGRVTTFRITRGPQYLAAADRVAPVSYAGRQALYVFSALSINLILLVGAALLFRRRASDPVVALLSTGMVLWSAGDVASLVALTEFQERLYRLIADGLVFGCLLSGIAAFPSGRFEPRWSLFAVPLLIFGLATSSWPGAWQSQALGSTIIALSFAISIAAVTRRYVLLPAGLQRQQIKWAVLGFAVFAALFVLAVTVDSLDSLVSDNTLHFVVLMVRTLSFTVAYFALVGGLLVSLLRYRLYDADAAISRSAVYGALTLALVAIFSGTEKLVELLGEEFLGQQVGPAAGAIAAGLAALFLVPTHHRLTAWAERRFQRDLVRLRTRLPERLRDMQLTATPDALAEAVLKAICSGVTTTRAAVLLPEREGWRVAAVRSISGEDAVAWLAATAAPDAPARDSLFPAVWRLAGEGEPASGLLVLGPRPDGSLLGKDERETLGAIAEPAGGSLATALALDAERQSLRARITELEVGLAGLLAEPTARARRRVARA